MDQQEETTEEINKRRRIQSPSTSFFPPDLIPEILSKLPAKSVGRFRCVSKLWSSITTDPYFINKFETQSRQKKPSLLVCFKKRGDRLFVFSIPQDRKSSNEPHTIPSQPVHSYHMTYPKSYRFLPSVSVHGLICCFQNAKKKLRIWNPTTRKLYILTKPEKSWENAQFLLGYDPTDAKYKVLCIRFHETTDEVCVLTLGSAQESWRRIKTNHNHCLNYYPAHVCTNGFLLAAYGYITIKYRDSYKNKYIPLNRILCLLLWVKLNIDTLSRVVDIALSKLAKYLFGTKISLILIQ
ncbi:hypothetical protein Bca52824_033523 [Brassica carinata]|uniref:F-box domain-containing protein n=1 Tax=Brassica carinata TaxID=52824 RepID=A0A8X7SF44_BRACI|nr:hypothetical protein Bca52824_033523 [Brassica carinata]